MVDVLSLLPFPIPVIFLPKLQIRWSLPAMQTCATGLTNQLAVTLSYLWQHLSWCFSFKVRTSEPKHLTCIQEALLPNLASKNGYPESKCSIIFLSFLFEYQRSILKWRRNTSSSTVCSFCFAQSKSVPRVY
jgi:hypothetical protein